MFHGHKHHHAKKYQNFDLSNRNPVFVTMSNGYPVYGTILEPMPFPEGQQFQQGNPIFNKNHMKRIPEEEPRGYEAAHVPVQAKVNKKKVEEDVDAEAEEFIQHVHKEFQLSKLRSELSGRHH